MIVQTNNFGNFTQVEEPGVLLLPVPYEYTTSFVKGTKNAPQAILNSSIHLESFDDELWSNINNIGINTANFLNCEFVDNKSTTPFGEVDEAIRGSIIKGQLPVLIGGESIISFGSIKALYDLYPDVSVLYFGARPHLKSSVKSNNYNHLCSVRRISELMPDLKIIQVGVRSISEEEADWLDEKEPNIEFYFGKDKNRYSIADMLSNLTKNVYISFNFNVFDSSVMPATTYPEPGGLSFDQVTDILKNVCTFKEIVGMDFTELAPNGNSQVQDFLAAKLIYKTIGYKFARELGAFEEGEATLAVNE